MGKSISLGKKGLSHGNISRISGKVVEEFNNWKRRDLSGLDVVQFFTTLQRVAA